MDARHDPYSATGAGIGAIFGGVGAIPDELVGGLVGGGPGALTNPEEIDLGEPV